MTACRISSWSTSTGSRSMPTARRIACRRVNDCTCSASCVRPCSTPTSTRSCIAISSGSNILVTKAGVPKLLDFGIAKLLTLETAGTLANATIAGLRPMTPAYASPEQVRGEPVTPVSDVYALGVLLYELLTECSPYCVTGETLSEMARVICEHEPEKPSAAIGCTPQVSTSNGLPGSASIRDPAGVTRYADTAAQRRSLVGYLDNIVLMALRKEPSRRYASVAQFADDVRRHLEGHTVLARRDTLRYRTAKFLSRNRAAVVSASAAVIVTI